MTRYASGYTGPMSPGGRPRPTVKPRDIGTGTGPRPTMSGPTKQALNKPAGMKNGGMAASKMGAVKTAAPSRDGVAMKGKTKGKQIVMAGNKGMKKGGKC